jgi:glycosyltransferase involved in cell wall biosynthesis
MSAEPTIVDFLIPQFQDPRIINAIESIKQHREADNLRIVVLDGGRDQALQQKIAASLRPHDIHRVAPDRGIYDALNMGLQTATAPWIGWLGSDDLLASGFSCKPLTTAANATSFVAFTTLFFRESDGKVTRVYQPAQSAWLRRNGFHLPHFSTFVRTAVAREIAFDIAQKNFADQLYMATLEDAHTGSVETSVSTLMCEGGLSNSSNLSIMKTNADVFAAMRSRKSAVSAAFYVMMKLQYKIWQTISARLSAKNISSYASVAQK